MPVALTAAFAAGPVAALDFPFGAGSSGTKGLQIAPVGGVQAQLTYARANGRAVARLSFAKSDRSRRLLAVRAPVTRKLAGIRSLKMTYRVDLKEGHAPKAVVAVFERDGAMWFHVLSQPLAVGRVAEVTIPCGSMRLAAFSRDESGQLEWSRVEKAWLGLVLDGPARGVLELHQLHFSTDPFRAAEPLPIPIDQPDKWNVGHDRRVKYTFQAVDEGPQGQKCLKLDFIFPVGKHMYLTPTIRLPECEIEGYSAIRFTYRALLPKGISGLLVTVGELDGSQYEAYPYPPPSQQWRTITIPFTNFRLAGWTRDENGRLDLGQLRRITIGVHGTATGDGGKGTVWIADLWLVP